MFELEIEKTEDYGDELMYSGLRPAHQFIGTGYTEETRLVGDFGSRIYYIKEKAGA